MVTSGSSFIMNPPLIENLVFEGGGVKGLCYVGCITVLEKLAILPNIKRVAGSSAGSIQAVFVACGASASFLKEKIWTKNFSDFQDGGWLPNNAVRLMTQHGINSGCELERWIEQCLFELTKVPNITFEQVKNKYGRELVITASNVLKKRTDFFSIQTTPTMPLSKAVRISSSIPLFFDPVVYEGNLYVDGGVMYNYPLDIFDVGGKANPATLGFSLGPEPADEGLKPEDLGIVGYVVALTNMTLESMNRTHAKSADKFRTVVVNPHDIKTTDFTLTEDQKRLLVASGTTATIEFFKPYLCDMIGLEDSLNLPTVWTVTIRQIGVTKEDCEIDYCVCTIGDHCYQYNTPQGEKLDIPINLFPSTLQPRQSVLRITCFDEKWLRSAKEVGVAQVDMQPYFDSKEPQVDNEFAVPIVDRKGGEVGSIVLRVMLHYRATLVNP